MKRQPLGKGSKGYEQAIKEELKNASFATQHLKILTQNRPKM